jgi:hypothetical protein
MTGLVKAAAQDLHGEPLPAPVLTSNPHIRKQRECVGHPRSMPNDGQRMTIGV